MKHVNQYQVLKTRQQQEFNKFPIKFAFNDEQFEQVLKEFGLSEKDIDKVIGIGVGGFIRETDFDAYLALGNKFAKEMEEAIENDKTGRGFVKDMFAYELANHEYGYTMDDEYTSRMMRSDQDWFEKREKPLDHPFIVETVGQRDEIEVGVMGFPEKASAEIGEKVCNEMIDGLVEFVNYLEENTK